MTDRPPQPAPHRASLLIVFLTVFIDLLGFGMVLPLLPIYASSFAERMSEAQVGWAVGLLMASFSAMQFLFAPLWGRLSDRVGRRPVLILGLAGSVASYLLFAVGTTRESLLLLFVSRIGAGIAGATIPTAQAYIADVTTREQRARGMALIGAAFGLGFTFGPLIGAAALIGGAGDESVGRSPWPGYVAAGLSATALLLAVTKLRESLGPHSAHARHRFVDFEALGQAVRIPSIGLLLLASFITLFSFANFESTLARLLKEPQGDFQYEYHEVLYAFAFVGLVLSVAQGVLVRRMAKRFAEGPLAVGGGAVSIAGFVLLAAASQRASLGLLLAALVVEVVGFSFLSPMVQSLISRRSDPQRQGGILGVAQSASALARVAGPVAGNRLFQESAALPFWMAAALMAVGLLLVAVAVRGGRDFDAGG